MGVAKIQISHRHVCCVRARWRGHTVIRCQPRRSAFHPSLVFGGGAAEGEMGRVFFFIKVLNVFKLSLPL